MAAAFMVLIKFFCSLCCCQNVACRLTLYGHIKTEEQRTINPLYSNTVIGTLAVDGWAVTFRTAKRGLGRLLPHPVSSLLYQV